MFKVLEGKLSDTSVYKPYMRARFGNHNTPILGFHQVIAVLKKEIMKTHTADVDKATDYRQMLVQVRICHR